MPNPKIVKFVQDDAVHFGIEDSNAMVMNFMDGKDLYMNFREPITEKQIMRVIAQAYHAGYAGGMQTISELVNLTALSQDLEEPGLLSPSIVTIVDYRTKKS